MQRMTLILLLVAGLAGIGVYYFEVKSGNSPDAGTDKTKAAFNFKREDVTALNITRGGQTVNIELQGDRWMIKQPINTLADENVMNLLIGELVSARINNEFPPSGDLKSYGLAEPPVKLEVRLKDGQSQRVDLGTKDPIGSSAYARINGGPNVAMLPVTLLSNTDKPVNDLRDRSLLNTTQYELSAVKITNESGSYELAKKDSDWAIKSPVEAPAEETEVNNLLIDITAARSAEVVSETEDDPAKYGLDKSKVKLTVQLATGGERTVSIGSKVDDKYYAKVSDRPQVVKVDSGFYDKLSTKLATLRNKSILKFSRDDITRVQIKNSNVTLVAEKNSESKWIVKEPADKKDKEVYNFKLFDPIETKASEVIDKPSAAIAAKLAKPAVEVRLTGKDGKTTVVKVSAADGDNAYISVEGRQGVFKVNKSVLESLNFKIDDAIVS